MPQKTFNPQDISVLLNGQPIVDFADDGGIVIAYDEDRTTHKMSLDGKTKVRNINPSKSGTITIDLLQHSPSNSLFNAHYIAQEQTGAEFQLTIKNASTEEVTTCEMCDIRKHPDVNHKKDVQNKSWVIHSGRIQTKHGSDAASLVEIGSSILGSANSIINVLG